MQVCTSLQTDNHASTPPPGFYRPDALPVAQPALKVNNIYIALKSKIKSRAHYAPKPARGTDNQKKSLRCHLREGLQTKKIPHSQSITHLVSAAYLRLAVNVDDACELHEAMMIEDVANAEVVAVTCEVVPLVDIDAVTLVRHDLHKR